MLTRGYVAQYEDAKAFVVTEATPEAAKALMAKLKERFPPAAAAQVGDESYSAEERLLGRLCFFRKGARVGGFVNVKAGDPVERSRTFAQSLP